MSCINAIPVSVEGNTIVSINCVSKYTKNSVAGLLYSEEAPAIRFYVYPKGAVAIHLVGVTEQSYSFARVAVRVFIGFYPCQYGKTAG